MDIKQLSSTLSVSGQIDVKDIASLSAAGYKSIICNRPNGESADQPAYDLLQQACSDEGMQWVYLPVIPGEITDLHVEQFQQVLAGGMTPILAFCRTGMRSTSLWALCEAKHSDANDLFQHCAVAGYDLTAIYPRLVARKDVNES